jgi:hypothetical protein
MTLASLNILAFAWHTALELLEPPWIAAREVAAKRTSFFAHLAVERAFPCPRVTQALGRTRGKACQARRAACTPPQRPGGRPFRVADRKFF